LEEESDVQTVKTGGLVTYVASDDDKALTVDGEPLSETKAPASDASSGQIA